MEQFTKKIWDLAVTCSKGSDISDYQIYFDNDTYEKFSKGFQECYDDIKDNYMEKSVSALDRHKVAAIIIVSFITAEPLKIRNLSEDKIFLGNENLAFEIGLSYMQHELNKILQKNGINQKIVQYKMPEAMACETYYIDIVCRNLYHNKKRWGLNPLDLAERLFLIEYITLISEGIDPLRLRKM